MVAEEAAAAAAAVDAAVGGPKTLKHITFDDSKKTPGWLTASGRTRSTCISPLTVAGALYKALCVLAPSSCSTSELLFLLYCLAVSGLIGVCVELLEAAVAGSMTVKLNITGDGSKKTPGWLEASGCTRSTCISPLTVAGALYKALCVLAPSSCSTSELLFLLCCLVVYGLIGVFDELLDAAVPLCVCKLVFTLAHRRRLCADKSALCVTPNA